MLISAIIAPYIKPNEKDALVLFGLVFPYIYLFAIACLTFTWYRNRITFGLLLLLVIGSTRSFCHYVKPALSPPRHDGNLHVLSFNTMMGVKLVDHKHNYSNLQKEAFEQLMSQGPIPDIICAQEVNHIAEDALRGVFDYQHYHKISDQGAVILSRYPMVNKGKVDFGSPVNTCLWADIAAFGDTIRVFSTHFESNRLNQSSYDFLANEDGYQSTDAVRGLKDLLVKYPKYATRRGQQALQVRERIRQSPHPVILAGDFNDPPMSYTYHVFRDMLTDTFLSKGRGWGTTWIGGIPLLRIDYILSSPELEEVGFTCLETVMSDHYPLIASYEL